MQAGGILLALALMIGAGVGIYYGQGSLGIIGCLVVGLIAVGLFAWRDARRRR